MMTGSFCWKSCYIAPSAFEQSEAAAVAFEVPGIGLNHAGRDRMRAIVPRTRASNTFVHDFLSEGLA
ncbi:hypothetical protein DPM33_00765 [Mesorhizobium hawassense]|uniref:Uncharacterized protein n=1 Tax=Mesorhizobium hawassense TaxID=1209954 RepID=A0A330HY38_9HYPH|nr:hypothetical protein DPM33_00765 [Mesorhizobium hawassense]